MAKAQQVELYADDSYGEAAARVISVRSAELIEHSRNVLDTSEIEGVHDMRVATRRLRAALEVFEPCLPRKPHRQALREVKRLADGLGERRERDVAIAALNAFNEQMHEPDQKGVSSLITRLREEQAEANRELAPLVDTASLSALGQTLEQLVASVRGAPGSSGSGEEAG
ncbi:MAG: CHAD domain-containing protein [Actinobacteria bacterium]|nr:CHAD domain-containing protein [Actinomycetota bacterium]